MAIHRLIASKGMWEININDATDAVTLIQSEYVLPFTLNNRNGLFRKQDWAVDNGRLISAQELSDHTWLSKAEPSFGGGLFSIYSDDEYLVLKDATTIYFYEQGIVPVLINSLAVTSGTGQQAVLQRVGSDPVFVLVNNVSPWIFAYARTPGGNFASITVTHAATYSGTQQAVYAAGPHIFAELIASSVTNPRAYYYDGSGLVGSASSPNGGGAGTARKLVVDAGAGRLFTFSVPGTTVSVQPFNVSGNTFTGGGSSFNITTSTTIVRAYSVANGAYIVLEMQSGIIVYKNTYPTLTTISGGQFLYPSVFRPAPFYELLPGAGKSLAALYDGAATAVVDGTADLANLKLLLLDSTASFNQTQTTISQVTNAGAREVSGNGWPVGGVTLTGVSFSPAGGNKVKLSADDTSGNISSGSLTAHKAVIYDSISNKPLVYLNMDAPITAATGESIQFLWDDDNGIIVFV